MASPSTASAQFNIKSLPDGNVELAIQTENTQVACMTLSPKQAGELAAHILRASRGAFDLADRTLSNLDLAKPPLIENPISPNDLVIGVTKTQGQHVVAFRVGDSTIGFVVPNENMRKLGRDLVRSAWAHSANLSLATFLRELVADFGAGLSLFSQMFTARIKAASRRRAASFWSIASGRSFQAFRTIKMSPGDQPPRYNAVGHCIYCDAAHYSSYSKRIGLRTHPFGGEHVVPEGIGGTIELPEASCQRCEEATGAIVEGSVLGRTLKALRVHLNLKKAGSGPHPKSLPLDATVNGVQTRIDMPVEDYPVVFMMVQFTPPDVSTENTAAGKAANGAVAAVLRYDEKTLSRKYGVTGFASAIWDNQMFCRMLAKIGHAFAVAELGSSGRMFSPKLLDLIVHGKINAMNLIGGPPVWEVLPPSQALHEVSLGYQKLGMRTYLVARVRLFARHGGPPYYVVVGESLESPIARLRRVVSNKISSVLKG